MMRPRLHPQYTAEYRLFRPMPEDRHNLVELREAVSTRVFAWRMQVTPLTQSSTTFQPDTQQERHLEGVQHVETWEGVTDARIHTAPRKYGDTETVLSAGPRVGDVFAKWEYKRSYLTGYPLPQRELTAHYLIQAITDGDSWHVFQLTPIGDTDENTIPAWDTYHSDYEPAENVGDTAEIGKFIRGGGVDCQPWMQLPSGEEVSVSLRSFLNNSGEGLDILQTSPRASEYPPGEKDAEGLTIARHQYGIPPGMRWDASKEEIAGTPSAPTADADGNRRAYHYAYFIAKNNFGADVGFLKIEIYHPDDGATTPED